VRNKWTVAVILIILIIAAGVIRNSLNHPESVEKSDFVMGTFVQVRAVGKRVNHAVNEAFREIKAIDALLSSFVPDSDISRLNAQAGLEDISVSKDTLFVLERAGAFFKMTGGAFDVTVGPLVSLWGFHSGDYRIPSEEEIWNALQFVGFDKVSIDFSNASVKLGDKGMSLDLGGAGKGYAVDVAYDILEKYGPDYALISAGSSSMRVLGVKPEGKAWKIGVGHPRNPNEYLGVVTLKPGEAIGTSGDYQKYFEEDGVLYSHILDPHTGRQPRELSAVTLIAPNALDADILSTAVFVLGSTAGILLVESLDGVEAVLFTANGEIILSSGMINRFEAQSGG
jgi:thiamine biosynthesis lipoprotein